MAEPNAGSSKQVSEPTAGSSSQISEPTAGYSSQIRDSLESEKAKALYLRQVEMACNMTPFLNQKECLFETSDGEKDDDSSEPESIPVQSTSGGRQAGTKKKKKHRKRAQAHVKKGLMTTEEERKKKSLRCNNFDPERQWLRDDLLTSTEPSSSSEDDSPEYRRIKQINKERRLYLKTLKRFNINNSKYQRMYYSSRLPSSVDRYPEYRPKNTGQPPTPKSRVKRKSADDKSMAARVRAASQRKKNLEIERAAKELARVEAEQAKAALRREESASERGTAALEQGKMASSERGRAPSVLNMEELELQWALADQERAHEELYMEVESLENQLMNSTVTHELVNVAPSQPEPLISTLGLPLDLFEGVNFEWDEHLRGTEFSFLSTVESNMALAGLDSGLEPIPSTSSAISIPTSKPTRKPKSRTTSKPTIKPTSKPIPKVYTWPTKAMAVDRKSVWSNIVKKEIVKVYLKRKEARTNALVQKKCLAEMCQNYVKKFALKVRKNEIKEIQTRRKLNFLITQAELCAYLMQRMLFGGDSKTKQILRQLEEEEDPVLKSFIPYNSATLKAKASRNARDVARSQSMCTQRFNALPRAVPEEQQDVVVEIEGDYHQPSLFAGQLKDYQLKGMNWIANIYDQGLNGILVDEEGLNKIIQCIAFLCHIAERLAVWGPFLVVTSDTMLHSWLEQMMVLAPCFNVVIYRGNMAERTKLRQYWSQNNLNTATAAHVLITSEHTVKMDVKFFNSVSWQYIILDEDQEIMSVQTVTWKVLFRFTCINRLLLLDAPFHYKMEELWAMLLFIMPRLMDSHKEFKEWFSKDVEIICGYNMTEDEKYLRRLRTALKSFMLRRRIKDVESELVDKVVHMVSCKLSSRQQLLYNALMGKIPIDDILYNSLSLNPGHNVENKLSADVEESMMQLRKVCNHPDLFKWREISSAPLSLCIDDYNIPELIATDGFLLNDAEKLHLLFDKLSIHTQDYISDSLKELAVVKEEGSSVELLMSKGLFGFSRLMNLSPTEIHGVAQRGWAFVMRHIQATFDKNERLRHRRNWWFKTYDEPPKSYSTYEKMKMRDILTICPGGDTLNQKKGDADFWKDFLFTDPQSVQAGPIKKTAGIQYCVPEPTKRREMRLQHEQTMNLMWPRVTQDEYIFSYPEPPKVFPDVEHPPVVASMMATPTPNFLFMAQPKVVADTLALSPMPLAFANHQRAECADEAQMLASLVARTMPPSGWFSLQVPDKNQLVIDSGKLKMLDDLVNTIKGQGRRVLIYSRMTKMINLLAKYLSDRKHAYMRVDGSQISVHHRIADDQARADVFVFLISTPADGFTINYTAADTVIFYDSDWNPTVDLKPMEDAHRLGQIKPITVYRLLCTETFEENIMQLAIEKSEELLSPGSELMSTPLSPGIERMLASGGNFQLDSLAPQEMLSLLLGDEVMQFKYLQILEQQRCQEIELPLVPRTIIGPKDFSELWNNLMEDDSSGSNLIMDISAPPSPLQVVLPPADDARRGTRGRRARQRVVRNSMFEPAGATDATTESDDSLMDVDYQPPLEPGRVRRARRPRRESVRRAPYARRSRTQPMPLDPL